MTFLQTFPNFTATESPSKTSLASLITSRWCGTPIIRKQLWNFSPASNLSNPHSPCKCDYMTEQLFQKVCFLPTSPWTAFLPGVCAWVLNPLSGMISAAGCKLRMQQRECVVSITIGEGAPNAAQSHRLAISI